MTVTVRTILHGLSVAGLLVIAGPPLFAQQSETGEGTFETEAGTGAVEFDDSADRFQDVAEKVTPKQSRNIFLHPGQNHIELVRSTWRLLEARIDDRIIGITSVEASSSNVVAFIAQKDGFRIEARTSGIGALVFRDADGRVYDVEVRVIGDTRHLDNLLRKLHPDARVETTEVTDSTILLRGTVETQAESQRIVDIASAIYPDVLNHLTVRNVPAVGELDKMMEDDPGLTQNVPVTTVPVARDVFESETAELVPVDSSAVQEVETGATLTDGPDTIFIDQGTTAANELVEPDSRYANTAEVGIEGGEAASIDDQSVYEPEDAVGAPFETSAVAEGQSTEFTDSVAVNELASNEPYAGSGDDVGDVATASPATHVGPTTQLRFLRAYDGSGDVSIDVKENNSWVSLPWRNPQRFSGAAAALGAYGGGRGPTLVAKYNAERGKPIPIRARTSEFRENVWVSGWILATPAKPGTQSYLQHFPVDASIRGSDIVQAAHGQVVTRIVTLGPDTTDGDGGNRPARMATGPDSYRALINAWRGRAEIAAVIILGPKELVPNPPALPGVVQRRRMTSRVADMMMEGEAGFENMGSDGFGRTAAGPGAYGAMAKGADPVAEEMKRLRQDVKALRGEIARLIQVLKKTPPASDAGAGDASTEGDGGFGFPGGTNDFEPGPGAIESDAGISDPGVGGFDSGADEGGTAPDPASSGYGPALVPDATGGASPGAGGGSSGSRRPGTSRSRAGSTPVPGSSLPSDDDVGSAAGIDSGRGGDSGSAAVSPERSSDNRPSLPQKSGNRRKERTVPLPNFDASAPEGGAAGGALDELPESGAAEGAAPVRKPPAGSETEGGTSADPGIDLGDEAGST